ncbi:MAG: hypothetical protein IT334_06640 [Thermomicrobiales bacterium]|nr:hypothetical protein [Thermomicrobiales bacterium]
MDIEAILVSNEMLGVAMLTILAIFARFNRAFLRDVWRDQDRFWRIIARLALVSGLALIVWGSVADNWRSIAEYPYRYIQIWESKRIEYNPPPDWARDITVTLLIVTLVLTACLVARHVGGYIMQAVLIFPALAAWIPLFIVRQRLDFNLGLGFGGSWSSPVDVIGYLLFLVAAWVVDSLALFATFVILLMLVALPITLLLDITRLRRPRVKGEATGYFQSMSDRSAPGSQP